MKRKVLSVGSSLLTAALALATFAGLASAQGGTTVATGLNGPQGVVVGPDGTIWVAEAGLGGEEEIDASGSPTGEAAAITFGQTARVVAIAADGTQTVAVALPSIAFGQEVAGAARLALLGDALYITNGDWIEFAGMERRPLMGVVARVANGQATEVADTWAFEVANNPDPNLIHSHPYDLAAGPDGLLWVIDAGGNDLIKVDPASGKVELVAVFGGVPSPIPNANRGGALESDPVPTGIAFDGAGNAYVSLLPGVPFLPGAAKVVKVGSDGAVSNFATGLTMLTDLQEGPDGMIYAVSIGQFTQQGPLPNTGAVLRIKEGTASEVVVGGLSFPTSLDFNQAGDAYVTINGIGAPGSGQVVRYAALTALAGSSLPAPASAAGAAPVGLPETGGSVPGVGWVTLAVGSILMIAGLALGTARRRGSRVRSQNQ